MAEIIGRVSICYRKRPAQMVRWYRLLEGGKVIDEWMRWGLVGCSTVYEDDMRRMCVCSKQTNKVVKQCPRLNRR